MLLLDLINKNLLAAAGIFIVVAAVAAAFMAYWIIKAKTLTNLISNDKVD